MDDDDPIATVVVFNARINEQDLDGLVRLMADDHQFIDTAGSRLSGRERCRQAWRDFFRAFPDYRNHFESITAAGELVVVRGRSTCADARVEGPAIWAARVVDGLLAEWRVYEDTQENRARLGLA